MAAIRKQHDLICTLLLRLPASQVGKLHGIHGTYMAAREEIASAVLVLLHYLPNICRS